MILHTIQRCQIAIAEAKGGRALSDPVAHIQSHGMDRMGSNVGFKTRQLGTQYITYINSPLVK